MLGNVAELLPGRHSAIHPSDPTCTSIDATTFSLLRFVTRLDRFDICMLWPQTLRHDEVRFSVYFCPCPLLSIKPRHLYLRSILSSALLILASHLPVNNFVTSYMLNAIQLHILLPLSGLALVGSSRRRLRLQLLDNLSRHLLCLCLCLGLILDLLLIVTTLSKLIDTSVVDPVRPTLVQVDEEDDIVTEGGQSVQDGHLDGEREEVVDEGVEELVHHRLGRHVRHALEAVIDVKRGHHHQETVSIHGTDQGCDDKRVPRLVAIVEKRVDAVR